MGLGSITCGVSPQVSLPRAVAGPAPPGCGIFLPNVCLDSGRGSQFIRTALCQSADPKSFFFFWVGLSQILPDPGITLLAVSSWGPKNPNSAFAGGELQEGKSAVLGKQTAAAFPFRSPIQIHGEHSPLELSELFKSSSWKSQTDPTGQLSLGH